MTDVTRNAAAATERTGLRRTDVGRQLSAGACGGTHGGSVVLIADRQDDVRLDAQRYRALVQRVLEAEGVPHPSETAVTFVDPDEMARLHQIHMGRPGSTDVLAFPIDLADGTSATRAPTDDVLVGDVVVCPAVAASNAAAGKGSREGHDGSVAAEIDLLVVHGVLHLLGMDHADPTDAAVMHARETEHLRTLWGSS
ncbi:rRNA maturation RNase YbeY [Candidatus Poriferisodalis sp.]|uniref:rRNA maturation RNase YbeY n=1 Tax=Candidatus Poriferisodalis sp. TaxID=3101277 RepID=UPI003B027872